MPVISAVLDMRLTGCVSGEVNSKASFVLARKHGKLRVDCHVVTHP